MSFSISKKRELEREAAVKGAKCFNSFYYFFRTFWPEMSGETYVDAKHIKYICDQLQYWGLKVIRRERVMKTIVINVPPGSSKSTIVTIAFPLWVWLRNPSISTANISYSATLSSQHAYKSRGITDSDKWHILFDNIFVLKHGKALEIVKQNQNEMLNNFKGNRFNTSVGGTILGMHADIFAKDDLVSAEQANSDVERVKANRWNDETTSSRKKVPDCYLDIYISQRLHEEDICGHVLAKGLDTLHICLPAEITPNNKHFIAPKEALELYTDGILDPNRRPKEVLEVLRKEMGAAGYAGQYLQTPFNLEEQPIKPSMFEKIDVAPPGIVWDLWIDGAYTEKTENDPTGIMVAGYKDHKIYVKEAYNVRMGLPDVLDFIKELGEMQIFDPMNGRIFIEPKATGYSLAQYIDRETSFNFVLIGQEGYKDEKDIVTQGKVARHNIIQPKAVAGRIKLLKGDWNEEFITQISGFPRAAHDEQVDNLGYAINHYFLNETTFIKAYAIEALRANIAGSVNAEITSRIDGYRIEVGYQEIESGPVQLFDVPYDTHNHRYITVLVPEAFGHRAGNTSILVFDRLLRTVAAIFRAPGVSPVKAGIKALELAVLFKKAKLAIVVVDEIGEAQTEEADVGHIAIREVRKTRYDNLYSRLTFNSIKQTREKEYGFILDRSSSREVFFNLKANVESHKIITLPEEIQSQLHLVEHKRDTGEITIKNGYNGNDITAFAVALKIDEEMYDDVKVRVHHRR